MIYWILLFLFVQLIFAFLGVVIFGGYSEDFSSVSSAFMSCLNLLVFMYDTDYVLNNGRGNGAGNIFIWSYLLICFFMLMNALLAIIVESYDRVQQELRDSHTTSAGELMYRQIFVKGAADLGHAVIKEMDLQRVFKDVMNNITERERVTLPGMRVHITNDSEAPTEKSSPNPSYESVDEWVVRAENLDGTVSLDHPSAQPRDREDMPVELLSPLRIMQVRLPSITANKIIDMTLGPSGPGGKDVVDYKRLMTKTRFYLLTGSDGKIKLLDQACLVAALRTVAPTMNLQCCYALSLNVLVRYGVNADVNGDGFISPEEWAALDKLLQDQGKETSTGGNTSHSKHRLISLMI